MTGLVQDLRHAARFLARRPGLTVIAVLCLAIGIGANTAIFSPVDVFLLRPLPYPQAQRLVVPIAVLRTRGEVQTAYSLPDLVDIRSESRTLDITGLGNRSFNLSGREAPERVAGATVTANFLRVLAVRPALGRDFLPDDEMPSAARPVILSHELWRRRFDGDPRVLGQSVKLDGTPYTVVGVMPAKFGFPDRSTDLWTTVVVDGQAPRGARILGAVARLRPGATLAAARTELETIARRLEAAYPETNQGQGIRIVSLRDQLWGPKFQYGSGISSVAVFFLLLITTANVANLLLAQAAGRDREIAVRTALGAGRWRISRQLLLESLLLGVGGGVVGLGLAYAGIRGLVAIMPSWFPGVERMRLDGRVFAFGVGVSLVAALIAGLGPALQAAHQNVRDSLQEGARGSSMGGRRGRLRRTFVIAEVALAIALLAGAGLLVRGFTKLQSAPLGFDTVRILTFRTALPVSKYAAPDAWWRFTRTLAQRLGEIPGVELAGVTSALPATGSASAAYQIEGEELPERERPLARSISVTPDYFAAVGMQITRGRGIRPADGPDAPLVAVVNQALVRRHWQDAEPLGRRIELPSGTWEIVGVIRDAQEQGADVPPVPTLYLPQAQSPSRSLGVAVRTAGDPQALAQPVQAAVLSLDPDQPIYDMMTMARRMEEANQADGVVARIMTMLAAIALLLAVVGVYGVMSYNVSQRSREVGIRMALGAAAGDVLGLVLRQSAGVVIAGTAIGVALALGLSRGLSIFLFGVSPFDPVTFGSVVLVLAGAALVASYLPARRATRVDPLTALRAE